VGVGGLRGDTSGESGNTAGVPAYLHGGLYDTKYDTNVAGMPSGGGVPHGTVLGLVQCGWTSGRVLGLFSIGERDDGVGERKCVTHVTALQHTLAMNQLDRFQGG